MTSQTTRVPTWSLAAVGPVLLVSVSFTWAFAGTLADLVQVWRTNDQYSHGFLVPGFALVLVWLRRDKLDRTSARPGLAIGSLLVALGLGLRLAGVYWYFLWLDTIAIIPCVAGLVWLLGGWAAWRWAWPAVLYLVFMVPLPYRLSTALSAPLQSLATTVSTFIMQAIGLPALSEGNVIVLNEARLNVVEACSGLRMLVVFIALSAAMALLTRRPLLDKLILLISAIPIAVMSNILRITATGILHETTSSETANLFFHDLGGWLMMPLGLLFLAVEVKLLSHLFIDPPPAPPRPVRDPARQRVRNKPPLRSRPPRPTAKPARKPEKAPPVPAKPAAERR
ncbi:MAG TPA: exosortase/archaeosortase family protein [Gemmataceae bacterium]|nr:exosortase/archaeosortase family protein [Gemmataceae bacterium]